MSSSSETKREKILKAAIQLFGQQGYSASMESVAKLADVSKQTVYSHFKNKDVLFETCMRDKCQEYQINKVVFDNKAPIDEVLLRFAQGFQETLLNPGALYTYRNAVSQIDTHPEFAATYLSFGPEKTNECLQDYLLEKEKEGIIKLHGSCEDAAIQLLLMLHGKVVYWRYLGADTGETEAQRVTYLKSCIDMFLSYVRIK
ncbi:TetR/AcrR family transcriptional regulator [Vibrio sp. DW001]|uniref:TetR/AcrR family transcriptional regulator n=1 Tax=Vibrio sp. DW001 TaxID=2912315 RepID=UPI0023B0D216|nr:TetR/AcrR family transcriptional regulator [Vibrio sp. DW001]WED28925.1 TetR/AcrR family transcriptional regulator [Vibrio sp. DW001]